MPSQINNGGRGKDALSVVSAVMIWFRLFCLWSLRLYYFGFRAFNIFCFSLCYFLVGIGCSASLCCPWWVLCCLVLYVLLTCSTLLFSFLLSMVICYTFPGVVFGQFFFPLCCVWSVLVSFPSILSVVTVFLCFSPHLQCTQDNLEISHTIPGYL